MMPNADLEQPLTKPAPARTKLHFLKAASKLHGVS